MKQIKKFLSVLMACVIVFSAMVFPASAASIYDTAKKLNSGETATAVLGYEGAADYKITVAESGTLKINFTAGLDYAYLYVLDADGNQVSRSDINVSSGREYLSKPDKHHFVWNSQTETIKATVEYQVKKGTYYIRLQHSGVGWSSNGNRKVSLTATFPSSSTSTVGKISCLQITVPRGTTLKLAAVISGSGTAKWTSSKPSVATVSSKGLITAKSKGFTYITCTLGSSKVKVRIKVT